MSLESLSNTRYKTFYEGNVCCQRFRDIVGRYYDQHRRLQGTKGLTAF